MIEIRDLTKVFRNRRRAPLKVLDRISLQVGLEEFVCVLGPSGCGKTTLLRILAGLTPWDTGEATIAGKPIQGPGPERAMVFQNFLLLPWATVLDNVAFGLRMRGAPQKERVETARRLIETVGLRGFEDHYPNELSGGMQQRVGLARALAVDPEILLMDEPFGSVDSQTRRFLQEDLLRFYDRDRKTIVFVTHSMDEAVRLADRIFLLSPRPARVVDVFEVPLPRPRPPEVRKEPAYVELKEYLWEQLRVMYVDTPEQEAASDDTN